MIETFFGLLAGFFVGYWVGGFEVKKIRQYLIDSNREKMRFENLYKQTEFKKQ